MSVAKGGGRVFVQVLDQLWRGSRGHRVPGGAAQVKILRGTLPQLLPAEAGNRIELVTNLKAANALDLTIPQPLLSWADEGI